MAAAALRILIGLDRTVIMVVVGGNFGIKFSKVEARAGGGGGEVTALMPAADRATPDQAADLIKKGEAMARFMPRIVTRSPSDSVIGVLARNRAHCARENLR